MNPLERIAQSFAGVVVGVLLIPASFVLLFWNEGRAVKTARSLEEGAAAVVSIDAARVDPAREGALVHLSGEATTDEVLADPAFAVSEHALLFHRRVSVYQWEEDEDTKDKETTYRYRKVWSEDLIDSSDFAHPGGHQNPTDKPFADETVRAEHPTLGAFRLSASLVDKIDAFRTAPVTGAAVPEPLRERLQQVGSELYSGPDPAQPQIGDARIRFEYVAPQVVSVIGRQTGDSFEPYPTKAGRRLEMLSLGTSSAEAMFAQAQADNRQLTWILRAAGVVALWIGLMLVVGPLSAIAAFVPILGEMVGAALALVSVVVALALSAVVVGVAWVSFRPVLGAGLLAAAFGLVVVLFRFRHRRVHLAHP
jgi:hypothetical protein